MILQSMLKQVYEWHKKELLLLFSIIGIVSFISGFYIKDTEINILIALLIGIKIIKSTMSFSNTPGSQGNTESFSWKYLQSLPIPRKVLIFYVLFGDLILKSPFLFLILSFMPTFRSSLDLSEGYLFLGLQVTFFYLVVTMFYSLFALTLLIHFPRLQFIKKNQKIFFYQNVRNLALTLFALVYGGVLLYQFSQNYGFQPFLPYLKFIANHVGKIISLGVVVILFLKFHSLQEAWFNEIKSYPKINWKPKRDFPVIFASILMALVPFEMESDDLPSMYRGPELLKAVNAKNYPEIKKLLQRGEDINIKNKIGFTPLMVAAHDGDFKMFQYLESQGAKRDGEIKSKHDSHHSGMNLFFIAIDGKNVELVNYLLKNYDVNSMKNGEFSPLHLATWSCDDRMVDLLISIGANVNMANSRGKTPLHNAIEKNCFSTATSLLENGANPLLKDKVGKLAMDYTQKNNEQLKYFIEKKTRGPAGKLDK